MMVFISKVNNYFANKYHHLEYNYSCVFLLKLTHH